MNTPASPFSCLWAVAATLGESPCWTQGSLWFVDIKGCRVHCFEESSGACHSWPAPADISFIVPDHVGQFIVGLPGMLARFSPKSGQFEPIVTVEPDQPHNRLNDACVDHRGQLWFGSMDNMERDSTGALYRWNGLAAPTCHDRDYAISNGPAFSPNGRHFYHTDTLRKVIYRFIVSDDHELLEKRPFIQIESGAGWPDGTTVDAEGCLWVAMYGTGSVRRYSPNGELLATFFLPCTNVTKLIFGGSDLLTAFVTTARQGLDMQTLRTEPLAGGVFSMRVKVPGLPVVPVRVPDTWR
ncbi:SMP-30/gluconolactonase/LRE family protein [Solimonas terrae]|uniref:SMP-30/gluconolactonase/LRE family protein n=1 Tax=Solimonas terrae TaxID=1396819 RepID=A0A6M2BUL7_9GAMM|nr:SMP-30/gluconolactonase/LRE family protein [Solimonas terrae]